MTTTRRLAAILAADVAGYSRLMGADEVGTLEALKAVRREISDPAIAAHKGRIVKTTGDGMLVEFASAVDAVTCAMSVQGQMAERGGPIQFRIGINIGDIISEGDDIFGDGVNVAARVENECEPGGVYISDDAHRQVAGKTKFVFDDLGERPLKNIAKPVRIYAGRLISNANEAAPTLDQASRKPLPLPDKPSIAVLPFQNLSRDPEQEYFADGMVEDIITALSRFKSLFVIARNSSFTYKGKPIDIMQVGRDLGVRYVLEGSIQKAGGRVRITAQLIEAATNVHLSADRFDGTLDDIFELQDKVTASVVGLVEPSIQQIEIQRALQKATNNLEAHDCYLRALPKYNQWTREANQQAYQLLSRAVELDPNYAAAYMQLSFCHAQRWMQTWTDDRAREVSEGDRLKERALELGKNDPVVLAGVAYLHIQFGGDASTAVSLIDRAVALNPNLSAALETSTWVRIRTGDPQLAIEHCHKALRLNPLTQTKTPLAVAYFLLGRKEESLACVEEALINAPRALPALRFAATIKAGFGLLEETRQLMKRIFEINPNARLGPEGSGWTPLKPQYRQKWIEAREVLVQLGYPE